MRRSTSSSPKPGRVGSSQASVIDRQSAITNVRGRINSDLSLPSTDHARYFLRSEFSVGVTEPSILPGITASSAPSSDCARRRFVKQARRVEKRPEPGRVPGISVSAFLPLTTGLKRFQHPSTRRPQYTDLIQAMIFQRSSSVLITSPKCGIGPTTASEPFRR